MAKEQKLQVPAYVKYFLDKQYKLNHNANQMMDELINIYHEWHDRYAYTPDEYGDVLTALWVRKIIDQDRTFFSLFEFLSDVNKLGYESTDKAKKFVIECSDYDEYIDKNFGESDIIDAVKFDTKEEAEAFIVKQYTIKEVYADEN